MRLEESRINPLKDFLTSLVKAPEEWITLNTNNIPIMALFFNSGGVICETHEELVQILKVLSEYKVIEFNDKNQLRITQYGKDAL